MEPKVATAGQSTEYPRPVAGPARWDIEAQGARFQVRRVDLGAEARRSRAEQLAEDAAEALTLALSEDPLDGVAVGMLCEELAVSAGARNDPTPRGPITGWSRKSRVSLLRTLASCSMVGRWGMLTLTVPGHGTDGTEWHDLVPTPAALKAARRAFRWRWERQFSDWSGCWKLEYQRRGAPHFHVGVQVPTQLPEGWTGAQVHEWVRATWHEVLCHPNAQQDGGCPGESCPHREHAVHGAQLDAGYSDRLRRAGDAFASYFAKHGVWSSKEYQHALPGWRWRAQAAELRDLGDHGGADQLDELADAWDHPGRWWGIENVERAPQADGEMTPAEVEAARLVGRKVMARRTWRYVEHAEGRRPVLTRRVPRSFYGTAGFWLLMRNPSEFRWWFLAEVRKVAQLHGVERARYLATICEPGGRPPPPRRRTPAQALEVSR